MKKRTVVTSNAQWDPAEASVERQSERREHLFALIRGQCRPRVVRPDGAAIIPCEGHTEHDKRVHLWLARTFLHGDAADRQLGNELIRSTRFEHGGWFEGLSSAGLLTFEDKILEASTKRHLLDFLKLYIGDWMTHDFRLHGANDNAGLGCAAAVAFCGELLDNPDLTAFARERLCEMDRLLDLRGYLHECNSPTYAAAQLWVVADLVEGVSDTGIKKMALRCERRVWQELLIHFHPTLKYQIGPYSRAYEDDNCLQCSQTVMVMYPAFGAISPFTPLSMLFPPPEGTFAHNGFDFQTRSAALFASCVYHPPLELAAECFNRKLPFSSLGSTEFVAGGDGLPAGQSAVSLHLEEDFGLGSFGSNGWNAQLTPLHLIYRRRSAPVAAPAAEHIDALQAVYPRMTISSEFAGCNKDRLAPIGKEIRHDMGAAMSTQQGGTALVGYAPRAACEEVKTIRLSLVFPLLRGAPDEILYGGRRVTGFSASFDNLDWCFIRDGEVYLGVYPLLCKSEDVQIASSQLFRAGRYGLVSFFSMCSFESRRMSLEELRTFGSGFVLEVGGPASFGSFERFRGTLCEAHIHDEVFCSERKLRYARPGVDLELFYDMRHLNVRRVVSGGRLVNQQAKLETSQRLPLVD